MNIFFPQEPRQNENQCYNGFMDIINILSFVIGLQNLELNITANDIDNQTQTILDDLHAYLDKLDTHLANQDQILTYQNNRLMRLEEYFFEKEVMAGKEK